MDRKTSFKIIIFAFLLFLMFMINTSYAKDLDRINKYYITADPRTDGSVDFNYYIEWEVLDSDSEGPLSWVLIGVPNASIDQIIPLSSNISNIRYYSSGGDYVRIDFNQKYIAGEVVKINFSFHQDYLYNLNGDRITYSYTPGWFNDIEVVDARVNWNTEGAITAKNAEVNSDGYYTWSSRLAKGKKINAEITYRVSAFPNLDTLKQKKDYNNANKNVYSQSGGSEGLGVVIFIAIFILVLIVCSIGGPKSGYRSHSGYGGYHSSYHSSCACACASSCACACACAGGGRAGCSKKDFYGTNLKVTDLNKVLKNE